MKNSSTSCYNKVADSDALRRQTFGIRLRSDGEDNSFTFNNNININTSPVYPDGETTPPSLRYASTPSPPSFRYTPTQSSAMLSPIDQSFSSSPAMNSPWSCHMAMESDHQTRLIGTLLRREGHIYSLATSGDLLYTGSESKSIRVWKNNKEFSGFKSNSGLVKAIIIAGERIFSGHQDGKIRIWKPSRKDPSLHKRIGTLPTFRAKFKGSFNPSNYVEARKAIWFKHTDAISSLSLSEDKSLLYSASWDTTFKVWRISDSKCLESIDAHDDTVNSIVATFDGLVFTGSADGSVKVWRRQVQGKGTKHVLSQTLLKQECAVTALAVDQSSKFLYCGSSDGLVNFWETNKFLCHAGVLKGHKLAVLCLATAGNLVFTGSADTNICVWRREEGVHVYHTVLTGHTGPVKCVAVEEDKGGFQNSGDRQYTVYSGSIDKSVKIWKVSAQATMAAAMVQSPTMAAAMVQSPPCPPPQQQHQVDSYRASPNFLTGLLHAR